MKKNFVTTLGVSVTALAMTAISTNASAGTLMKKNSYLATYALTQPLYTEQVCEEGSYLGRIAANGAVDQAMDECHEDNNVDCVTVSTQVWAVSSSEFVGYKKCMAKAVVHGYEVTR